MNGRNRNVRQIGFDGAVRLALHAAVALSGAPLESPRVNRSLPSRISLASSNGGGA